MSRYFAKRDIVIGSICCFIAAAIGLQAVFAGGKPAGYQEGLKHYGNNEPAKAIKCFKDTLAAAFPEAASGEPKESEKVLLSRLDDEKTAALANYQLGLIYESQGKIDDAAIMLKNAATLIADKGAAYIGLKACKMCHIKQWKSWKKTKMAQAFETLKPTVRAEAKTRLKLDPQKDYTKDAKCLGCHTTGFGLPGGYKIAKQGDAKAVKRAKDNEGVTCEACHGPGSKFKAFHKETLSKKRQYTQDELYQLGQHKIDAKACTTCHNRRNPTVGADYHFDYEKYKAEDTHENVPLKYRAKQ